VTLRAAVARLLFALLTLPQMAVFARGDDAAANLPAMVPAVADVAPAASGPAAASVPSLSAGGWQSLLGSVGLDALIPSALMFGVVSLAPAVLLMTTCFVRMSVVLSLLRQGLGAPQIPSNQIVASLAIFLSALVMWPVWTQAWREGVEPYRQGTLAPAEAFTRGSLPVRRWMAAQIEQAGNRDTMLLFLERHPGGPRQAASYDDVPLEALLPAFLVSELETAFSIGFRLLLPFLVLDILVATLVVSTGLVMLPPTLVSLPLKLLVFVAADGWTLVVQSLLDSVRTLPS
jgi:flagellar biosynthetic protein FliP